MRRFEVIEIWEGIQAWLLENQFVLTWVAGLSVLTFVGALVEGGGNRIGWLRFCFYPPNYALRASKGTLIYVNDGWSFG